LEQIDFGETFRALWCGRGKGYQLEACSARSAMIRSHPLKRCLKAGATAFIAAMLAAALAWFLL